MISLVRCSGELVLVAVAGSSGFGEVEGVASTHPTALLEVVTRPVPSHVLYLVPTFLETSGREQAHVLIAAHPQTQVHVLAADHHALTLTLIGAVLAEFEGTPGGWTEPGEAVQLIRQSIAHSRSLLWHPRVVGLHEPQPTAGQRLSSVLRRPGFVSEVGVPDSLEPAREGIRPNPREAMCVAGPVPQLLSAHLEGLTFTEVDIASTVPGPYSTRGTVEIAGLVRPTRSAVAGPLCPSCAASRIGDLCVFCGVGPRVGSNEARRPVHRAAEDEDLEGQAA